MLKPWFLFSLFFFACSIQATARAATDTLVSPQKDQIIVSYDLKRSDERVELQFTNIRIKYSHQPDGKRKKASEIVAVFFDRVGGFDDIRFSGITPKSISMSPELAYSASTDGYFFFDPYQYPALVFDGAGKETSVVNIPVYLAQYKKKRYYEILSCCGTLEIKIAPEPAPPTPSAPIVHEQKPTSPQPIEMEEVGVTPEDTKAINLLNSIMRKLPNQTEAINETLEQEIKNLIDIKSSIENEEILKLIDEATEAYEQKKKELEQIRIKTEQEKTAIKEEAEAFNQCISIESCDLYLNRYPDGLHAEEVKAKKAELQTAADAEKHKEKKRTIWMIIGGILLAILFFVANQVMQTLRNKRTQRDMKNMQENALNQAQRQAQEAIRKQTNQTLHQAQQQGQDATRSAQDGTRQPKGNNNRITI